MRLVWYAALALFVAGCHTYRPVTGEPQTGRVFRAELTDAGTAELGRLLGLGVGRVEGRLVGSNPDQLRFGVTMTETRSGTDNIWRGEEVAIPRNSISTIREKKLSRSLTTLAAVGSALGVIAIYLLFEIGGGGDSGGPETPPVQ